MGLELTTIQQYDLGGGLNLRTSATKSDDDESTVCTNIDLTVDGSAATRNGSRILNVAGSPSIPSQIVGAPRGLNLFNYVKSTGAVTQIVCAGTSIYHSLTAPTAQVVGLSPLLPIPDIEFQVTLDDEYAFWGNGVNTNLKYNGTSWTNWSIATPIDPTFSALAAGTLPAGDYTYYVSYARTVLGVIVQESDLDPSPLTVTVPAGPNQQITINIPVSADSQVNARVIYRISPSSAGVAYRHAIVADNIAATYTDNNVDDGTIEAQFDNQPAPLTQVFEEYMGRMYIVDVNNKTDVYYSKPNLPWNVPTENFIIFDGPVRCIKRTYGALIFGTDRSIWVLNGDVETNEPRRISSKVGILNNKCAAGEDILYIITTQKQLYAVSPTDFSQSEMRFDNALSYKVSTLFEQFNNQVLDQVGMEYYVSADLKKLAITCPIGGNTNNVVLIYNETQSLRKQKPVWQVFNNWFPSFLREFTINNVQQLIGTDYNGFIWKYDDASIDGDGAEINGEVTSSTNLTLTEILLSGTATSGTANSLTDNALTMVANEYAGKWIIITAGTGAGQQFSVLSNNGTTFQTLSVLAPIPDATSQYAVGQFTPNGYVGMRVATIDQANNNDQTRLITSNNAITLTISNAWGANPPAGTVFTIGGYDSLYYSNWKFLIDGFNALKQLWYIFVNANTSGAYTIDLLLQIDFDQTPVTPIPLVLNANNSIWGSFTWGVGYWGAQAVFDQNIRVYSRFRSCRIGFRNRLANQPFQINGFSLSVQDKKLFMAAAT